MCYAQDLVKQRLITITHKPVQSSAQGKVLEAG
jgi:hypothetical protein